VTVAFTLCSNNYLGQAKVLAESYIAHHPEQHFVIGLVDRLDPSLNYKTFQPADVIPFEQLGYPEFDSMTKHYGIIELNTAVKPFYFEYLFTQGYEDVIYFDPDIVIFRPLSKLSEWFAENDILLTPHTLTPTHSNSDRWQLVSNLVGVYNLGFLGLRKSVNTAALITWWKGKLERQCLMVPAEGYFVDQIWANFFPVYFKGTFVIEDPGYNVAYWNFGERLLSKKNGSYFVNDSPLVFFHFSNHKLNQPDVISTYSDYTFQQRPDLIELYDDYRHALNAAGHATYSRLKPLIELRPPPSGFVKMTGLRIKVHGTKFFHRLIKTFFGV
jgi:hypothetical protein